MSRANSFYRHATILTRRPAPRLCVVALPPDRRPGSLTAMPDEEQTAPAAESPTTRRRPTTPTAVFSGYGIGSAVLGALCGRGDRAGRPDLDRAPQRRRRTQLPDPGHAGRRRLDRRADQHEHRQRRGRACSSCTTARSVNSTPTSTRPSSPTASGAEAAVPQPRPGRVGGGRDDAPRTWTPSTGGPRRPPAAAGCRCPSHRHRAWWWRPRSARTPAASRRPCTGIFGSASPTSTASC